MRRHRLLGLVLLVALAPAASSATADTIDDYIRTEMKARRIPGLTLAVVLNGTVTKMQG